MYVHVYVYAISEALAEDAPVDPSPHVYTHKTDLERIVLQLERGRVAAARVPEAVSHFPLEERRAVPAVPVPEQRLPLPAVALPVSQHRGLRVGGARGGGPQPAVIYF